VHSNKQADSEIHDGQLLNFVVNRLDGEISLSLANNAEMDAEDIYQVPVGSTADGTSISTLCNSSEDSPSANAILYHLRTKFEQERLERVANTLLRRDIVKYRGGKPRGFTVLIARPKPGRAVAGEFNSPRPSRNGSAGINTRTLGASVRVGGSTPPDNSRRTTPKT